MPVIARDGPAPREELQSVLRRGWQAPEYLRAITYSLTGSHCQEAGSAAEEAKLEPSTDVEVGVPHAELIIKPNLPSRVHELKAFTWI